MSDNFGVDSDPEIFEVESIIGKMYRDGQPYYLIHWKHYDDPKYDTWEPKDNLGCPEILEEFEKSAIAKKADEKYRKYLEGRYKINSSKDEFIQDIDEVEESSMSSPNRKKKKSKKAKKLEAVYEAETNELSNSSSDNLLNEVENIESKDIDSSKKKSKSSKKSKPKQQKNTIPEANLDTASKLSPKKKLSSSETTSSTKKSSTKPKESKKKSTPKPPVEEPTDDDIPLPDNSEEPVPNQNVDDDSDFDLEAFKKTFDEDDSKKDQEFNQNAKATFILKKNSEYKHYKHKGTNYHALYGIDPEVQLPSSLDGTAVVRFSDASRLKTDKCILAHLESGKVVLVSIELARKMSAQKLIDCLIEEKLRIDTKNEKDLTI